MRSYVYYSVITNFKLNNSKICISTQAAEKIYSGYGYPARVENKVIIDDSSTLFWMPQELILFNNSKLERNSYFDLKYNSNLLICETIIFGRRSMNENIENILISDHWEIKINDKRDRNVINLYKIFIIIFLLITNYYPKQF